MQDQPQDYSSTFLRPWQLFNHFQNNTEITTKSGLCRTLYNNTSPQMKTDRWFPRCYDLSQAGQTDDLVDDYLRTAAQIIVKKHYKLFKWAAGTQMKEAEAAANRLRERKSKGEGLYNYQEIKSNLYWEFIQQSPGPDTVLVNVRLLERAMKFCKQLLKNEHCEKHMNDLVKDELRPKDAGFGKSLHHYGGPVHGSSHATGQPSLTRMYSEKYWQQLVQYSKLNLPIEDFSQLPLDLVLGKKDLKSLQAMLAQASEGQGRSTQDRVKSERITQSSGWEKPSLYLMYRVAKCHAQMKKYIPQYQTDGVHNVWIVKPCYNARGFGIYCIDNCL